MKKLLPILLVAVLVLLGCQQAVQSEETLTVASMINSSQGEVDLSGVTCNEDVTVTKAVKIKNGDFNGKTLTINVSGVTLENAKNVNVVVAEAVGDGDFTVTASDITSFKVLGGGANSIHVKDTKVSEIFVAKDNVRVSFEGKTNITKLQVKKGITAKVEVNSSEVKIDAAEVVAEDGSKLDGESVTLTVANGVSFTAPEGTKAETASAVTEFTLSFDDTKISVAKDVEYLKNGDKVNKGDSIKIYVTNIEKGKTFDKFVISGKEYNPEVTGVTFRYAIESLDSTYANGSVIEISYTTKDLIAYTVTFEGEDGGTISRCEIVGGNDITNGSIVYEGQMLGFTATPSEGKVVDKWYVNGTEQSDYASEKYCYVTLRPSEITGTEVKVTCSFQEAVEYTVTFGEGISCSDITNLPDTKPIVSDSTVYEGQVLEFIATLPEGKVVDKWYINGKEQSDYASKEYYYVTLQASEITGNTVTVTYK